MEKAKPSDYIQVARLDHWVKQLFVLPGAVLAWVLSQQEVEPLGSQVLPLLIGVVATSFIASANYLLNEWLDASYDKYHPLKSRRPFVQRRPQVGLLLGVYAGLA